MERLCFVQTLACPFFVQTLECPFLENRIASYELANYVNLIFQLHSVRTTSVMTECACSSVRNINEIFINPCDFMEKKLLKKRWIHINTEMYDISLHVRKAVHILYGLLLHVFVHFYRYISVCSYYSSFLLTKQRFTEE